MADLQLPVTAFTSRTSLSAVSSTTPTHLTQSHHLTTIGQMVLKLTQAAVDTIQNHATSDSQSDDQSDHQSSSTVAIALSQETGLKALQQLIDALERVKAMGRDDPACKQLTPAVLLPEVWDEAQTLLDLLQTDVASSSTAIGSSSLMSEVLSRSSASQKQKHWQGHFTIQSLSPWLMWCTARSAYDVMRMMEGMIASIAYPRMNWTTGVLRLLSVIDLQTDDINCSIDLATGALIQSELSGQTLLQADQCALCREAIAVDTLKQRVTEQLQASTPEIQTILRGLTADTLIPHQDWQSGHIQFRIALQFTADADDMAIDRVLDPESRSSISRVAMGRKRAHSPSLYFDPPPSELTDHLLLKLTDSAWLSRYATNLLKHHLSQISSPLPRYTQLTDLPSVSNQAFLLALVEDVEALQIGLKNCMLYSSYEVMSHELCLPDLASQLMWSFSRSAFEVMQLISGVRATLLQPTLGWKNGILRLIIILQVKTSQQSWQLDVVTGCPPKSNCFGIDSGAIAQSNECTWCQQLDRIEHLNTRLMEMWRQHPDIQLWLDGTSAKILANKSDGEPDWQPCTIEMKTDFEFIADL